VELTPEPERVLRQCQVLVCGDSRRNFELGVREMLPQRLQGRLPLVIVEIDLDIHFQGDTETFAPVVHTC
jgi:hypothetical protein